MRFLNPAGLWLLLGVPILIIIYLIKAQHEERQVSSTYIWKLSEKFMKKRLPIQRINKILLFILQMLMIIVVSLMIARPAISNGKSCEYIAILDGSASMRIADKNGKTRFEKAVDDIEKLGKYIEKGHKVTVILASDNVDYVIREADSTTKLSDALKSMQCGLGGCNIVEAVSKAEFISEQNGDVKISFYTDSQSEKSVNVEVINYNSNEWNVVVENVSVKTDEKNTVVKATVTSYNSDTTLAMGLRLDGYVEKAQYIDLKSDEPKEVEFIVNKEMKYDVMEVFTKIDDGLLEDNSYSVCKKKAKTYKVLLASKSPFYLESVLNALGNCNVTTINDVTSFEHTGYDLYIFDGAVPEEYPQDGSIISIGAEQLPDGVYGYEESTTKATLKPSSKANKDVYEEVLHDISLNEAVVSKYTKLNYNLRWNLLLECDGAPVCVTKNLEDGKKFTVLSFDLHNSNLPLLLDYILFVRNLVEYSVPSLVKGDDYAIGEKVKLTVMPNTKELYIEQPDGQINQLSTDSDTVILNPSKLGVYTAVMTTEESGEYADFYVHIPKEESGKTSISSIEANITINDNMADEAFVELWYYLAVALLILMLIEWGCYYYEQY